MHIPDDDTGAALRRLVARGSDLKRPMQVDFFVAVPTQAAGEQVAKRANAFGFTTTVEQNEAEDGEDTLPWICCCTKTMVPRYDEVVKIEEQLEVIGREVGGYADGFGSFGNAPKN